MTIRRLVASDAAGFRALRLESLRDTPWAFGATHAESLALPLAAFADRLARETVAGAFVGGALAGIATMERETGGHVRHRAYVAAVYVRTPARGQGLARRMLDWLAGQAAAEGILQLELHVATGNAPAIAAYTAAGFERHGLVPRAILCEGRFLDECLMVRFLDR
jgi:ribosomal protein S18 acetylase RimI-like enzyme